MEHCFFLASSKTGSVRSIVVNTFFTAGELDDSSSRPTLSQDSACFVGANDSNFVTRVLSFIFKDGWSGRDGTLLLDGGLES